MWRRGQRDVIEDVPAGEQADEAYDGLDDTAVRAPAAADVAEPIEPIEPIEFIDDRFGYAKGVAVGLVVGILGTLGVQFGIEQFSKFNFGREDPLGYVSIAHDALPNWGKDAAIAQRLENDTQASWDLTTYWQIHPGKRPVTLPAARETLEKRIQLPDASKLQRVITNVDAPGAEGTIYILWFTLPNKARDWLMQNPHVMRGADADVTPLTLWAGDIVVYYLPGERDVSAKLKTWLKDVSRCPTVAGDC
ncbi:MAG: hypothetical protein QM572_13130 [Nocardioides sp.]|uniref:hypothetical protein n=1 Tax=Nocardioides sp. TaxID=35761 RepID=UPI0039E636C7